MNPLSRPSILVACASFLFSLAVVPSAFGGPLVSVSVTSVSARYTQTNPSSGSGLTMFQVLAGTGTGTFSGSGGTVATGLVESSPETINLANPPPGFQATITPNLSLSPSVGTAVFSFSNDKIIDTHTITGTVVLVSNTTTYNLSAFSRGGLGTLSFNPPTSFVFVPTGGGGNPTVGPNTGDPFTATYGPGVELDISLVAVPEPSAIVLGLSGLLGLGGLAWFRRRRAE